MKLRKFLNLNVFLLFLLWETVIAQAAPRQLMRGQMPPGVAGLPVLGDLAVTNQLNLAIGLPLRNQEALTNLLRDIYDPGSPGYHHFLTPEEFTTRFGPTEKDYQSVVAFAKANGLQVTRIHPNRMLVDVRGTVANIERAMHVTLRLYQHPHQARQFYAPDAEPSLDLAVSILSISGLDNYSLPSPRMVAKLLVDGQTATPNSGSGPGGGYMGKDFRAAYLPGVTLTGAGQTVGLLQFDGYTASDITYYESLAGLPNVTLQNVLIDGASGNPSHSGGEVEVSLDIETAISMAPGLSKVMVYMAPNPSPWEDILNRMANDNLAKTLSCSWYQPNGVAKPTCDQIFQQMAAQGQSFYNASGDYDAYTGLIDFPGDTPYITQVGGTTLTTSGAGGSYVAETVWNRGNGIGSGGGISTQYAIPDWQTNISMASNQGSTTKRNTPDVALTAENVYVRANGVDYTAGGTSCAAPLWAGFGALVNQEAMLSGKSTVGFINPLVDQIGAGPNYTARFHDITTGDNTSGSSPTKFYAVSGYDLCTGWGTPAGQQLIDALANPEALVITPASGFSAIGGTGGPFTITTQSLTLTNSGTNALSWSLVNTSVWLDASPTGGNLVPGGAATLMTVSLNGAASNLVVGEYAANLQFTNLTSHVSQVRQYHLSVIAPPAITNQPTDLSVLEGGLASFTVGADGGQPLAYQWQHAGTNLMESGKISGSMSMMLTVGNVSSNDEGTYTVTITNLAGSITSSNATLSITPSAPVIIQQPTDQSTTLGSAATFTLSVIGSTPFHYQWSFAGTNIDGATNAILTLNNVQFDQAGYYGVEVTNIYGLTNSAGAELKVYPPPISLFFDDFTGADLNPIWQTNLPDAHCGSFPSGTSEIAKYIGGPSYGFETLGTNSVLRLTNSMGPLQRRGWSSKTNFLSGDFRYEARFNTLNQSPTTSIDAFIEIWIMDASDNSRYDIISPFGGGFGSDLYVFIGSSIDNSYTHTSYQYQNNTWYRLILESAPGQNIRASLCDDNGTELVGRTLAHNASAFGSGFKIVLAQAVGASGNPYPVDVAVDYVKLTTGYAPVIQTQPTNQIVVQGGTAAFSVSASGTAPLNYQWTFDGTNLDGATNATLVLNGVQSNQAGYYAVAITNVYGSVLSSNALLTVGQAPTITTQPTNQTVLSGSSVAIVVAAAGSPTLTYQWKLFGTNIVGATNNSLNLGNVQFSQTGAYSVLVSNPYGSILSSNAILTVLSPPIISGQPANQIVPVGGTATFVVSSTGTVPFTYQWMFGGTNIDGATNAILTLTNAQLWQSGSYSVTVSNDYGSVVSSNAVLTVYGVAPFIVTQPVGATVALGNTASFNVVAGGTPTLTYQWKLEGTNLPNATSPTLTLTNIQLGQAGNYSVAITNAYGFTNSVNARLTVNPPPASAFFDDFTGLPLNSIWQTNLPNAHCGSFPSGSSQIATYIGGPNFGFETLGTNSVLRLTNSMGPLQRRGWGTVTNFVGTNFYYEARFNTLNQSSTTSIDGFIEIWIMDASDNSRYDIVSPFGGGFGSDLYVFIGSSIDNAYTHTSYHYQNNTWYRLVLKALPGQNIRASLCDDNGTELVGRTLNHGSSAFASGFKIVLSQVVGASGVPYPVDVAVDYVKLTTGFPPAIVAQPTNQIVRQGQPATFSVVATGFEPLYYQWSFNGTNISGATGSALILTNVLSSQSGSYAVTVTNLYGSVISSNAYLTVLTQPLITQQPANQVVPVGGTATFVVTADGTPPLSYQWTFGGTNLIGATNDSLILGNLQWTQAGVYAVVITNAYGSVLSSNALLTVTPDHFTWNSIPSLRFVNVPIAVTVQARDVANALITNFNGVVQISSTNGVPIVPAVSGSFAQGTWMGSVTVPQIATHLVLRADDGLGHYGLASPFDVIPLPSLTQKRSGNSLLILWPAGAPGFVLETSGNLAPGLWIPVTDPPFVIGDQYVYPVTITDTNRFYRLRLSDP